MASPISRRSNRNALTLRVLDCDLPDILPDQASLRNWSRGSPLQRLQSSLCMSNRVTALSQILRSPVRILSIVLVVVFTVEVAVMFLLPHVVPTFFGEFGQAFLDAVLLTVVCAPALWWIIIGPLRRVAIQEHQRSETIVANAGEGILSFDAESMIVSCNRAGTHLFGREADELVGKSIRVAIPDLPDSFEALPTEYRLDGVRSDGGKVPLHVSISEYPSETQPLHIAIIRDLTAAQRAEQERITMARQTEALRAQQMATLAQLATGVAHEIRNPLTSIKMLIQVNRAKFAEMGLPTSDLELVEQEIRRMERSVNSLLDYARPDQSEFCRFEIQRTIRQVLQLIEGRCVAQKVTVRCDLPNDPVDICGDPAQIQQLLLNLALNALDARPEGAAVHLSTSRTEDRLEINVADTGKGIAEEVKETLFSPFVTTKANGIGLGLGICRRLAEAHHGTLDAANRPGSGAQFKLTLPTANQNAAVLSEED